MDPSVGVRPAVAADLEAIAELIATAFHDALDPEQVELEKLITEVDRSLVGDDAGRVVAHAAAQTRELTVPGAVVPAAHVTGVAVAPTHHRRGLLTTMMRRQLGEIAAAGREPLAVLWASETAIYPRFGYGGAAARFKLDIRNREVRLSAPPGGPAGTLRLIKPRAERAELARIHDRVRGGRPGWSSRPDYAWTWQLSDLERHRDGATELRGVLLDGPDGPCGYALYRVKENWTAHGPDSQLRIKEIVVDGPRAYAQIWEFLLGMDLIRSVQHDFAAVDEPLQFLVDEPRRLGRSHLDALWIRVVDLPAALAARRYATAIDAVLEVTDPLLDGNSGRWRLSGDRDTASCTRTTDAPDLSLSITDLGAAYLGGVSLGALVAAGRVRQRTANPVAAAFGWPTMPGPIEMF